MSFARAAAAGKNADQKPTSGLMIAGVPIEQVELDPELDCETFKELRAATWQNAKDHAKEKSRRAMARARPEDRKQIRREALEAKAELAAPRPSTPPLPHGVVEWGVWAPMPEADLLPHQLALLAPLYAPPPDLEEVPKNALDLIREGIESDRPLTCAQALQYHLRDVTKAPCAVVEVKKRGKIVGTETFTLRGRHKWSLPGDAGENPGMAVNLFTHANRRAAIKCCAYFAILEAEQAEKGPGADMRVEGEPEPPPPLPPPPFWPPVPGTPDQPYDWGQRNDDASASTKSEGGAAPAPVPAAEPAPASAIPPVAIKMRRKRHWCGSSA
eukprot:CAMPEP_0119279958 /NCGR_PEP_ID=MMETSP1329-20130426/21802_1 /TAXON_ID=114041 /ORGANISM="Genus nov. species nov., Strain RCC1024" /LENGTH=327 /DNA_ID=CAMNT_0007280525 /DNA_START=158 /DNA_END=1138 /DNA_ORIENTATION=+